MMNQFIIPFRKISPNKILQTIVKINWSQKSDTFFQLPYTTERNENSERVHSAVNRCADRSGNISAASNTQSVVNLSQKLEDILNNQTKIRKIKYLTHPSKICWDPYVDGCFENCSWNEPAGKLLKKLQIWFNFRALQRAATENCEGRPLVRP